MNNNLMLVSILCMIFIISGAAAETTPNPTREQIVEQYTEFFKEADFNKNENLDLFQLARALDMPFNLDSQED